MFSSRSHPAQAVRTIFCSILGVAIALLIGATVPSAHAETVRPCLGFNQALELDDGSVIAAGADCVTKFGPGGELDSGFGSGGATEIPGSSPEGDSVVDLLQVPDGYVVVRTNSMVKLTADGTPDAAFGENGLLEVTVPVPYNIGISDATADPDGNIFFSGWQGIGGRGTQTIAKLKPTGALDPSFGEGGVFWEESPDIRFHFERLELDREGRLLAAGYEYDYQTPIGANLIRFTATGEVDVSFGTMGIAKSLPIKNGAGRCEASSCSINISGISVDADQRITLLGDVYYLYLKSARSDTFWAEFDPDGDPTATSADRLPTSSPAIYKFPNGDLLLRGAVGWRVRPDGSEVPGWHAFDVFRLAEYGFDPGANSYNAATGHVLAVGTLAGQRPCERYSYCATERSAITKIDGETGAAIRAFGGNGAIMAAPNECLNGEAPQLDGYGPWRRCALASPAISATARISKGRTRRPALRVRVELSSPPEHPLFLKQEVRVKLPGRLKLKKRALRSRLSVETDSEAPGSFRTAIKGRTLTIRFTPRAEYPAGYDDPYYDGDQPSPNGKTEAVIHLKRGSLRAFPKRLRGWRLSTMVSGRVLAQTEDTIPWWGPSAWTQKKVRAKVPR